VYAVLSALLLLLNEIHVKSCSRKKMCARCSTFRSPIPGHRASSSIEAFMICESDCKYMKNNNIYMMRIYLLDFLC
jgi:hypothetical protein